VLALQQSPELVEIREAEQALSPTAKLHSAFADGFDGLLFGACLVCLSSLLAVTTLRVQSHAQSIGVLLSIGLRKSLLYRAFLEEVFTRQLAAALLGAASGTFVAMMVTAQYQALLPSSVAASDSSLLALPAVPWHLLGTIFLACAVLSAIAALVPLRSLLSSSVVTLLKRPPTLPVEEG
jgi:ABC-type antimicrobial peptide transport system permease subunit